MTMLHLKPLLAAAAVLMLSACATIASVVYPLNEEAAKAEAGTYELDPKHASVTWAVSHFGFSTYRGRFDQIEGSLDFDTDAPETSTVAVTIKTDSLHSGVPALDDLLWAATMFDAANHPEISFISRSVTRTGDKTADIDGILTIKDGQQPVILKAAFVGSGTNPLSGRQTIGFSATTNIKRSDFGLKEWLPFVGDDVSLTIDVEFFEKG